MLTVYKVIDKFISEMKYLENEHVLGAFFFGSWATGYGDQYSDVDLSIVLDNSDLENYVIGRKYVNGFRIQYQEKPINLVYAEIYNNWERQQAGYKSKFGKSKILFDKTGRLKKLQEYTLEKYSNMLPKIDEANLRANKFAIDSEMEVLKRAAFENSPNFLNLYFYIIEVIRVFYHRLNCLTVLNMKKVYRAYTDDGYRRSINLAKPDEKYVEMYLNLISDTTSSNEEKLNNVINFYNYVKKDLDWDEKDQRIVLKI